MLIQKKPLKTDQLKPTDSFLLLFVRLKCLSKRNPWRQINWNHQNPSEENFVLKEQQKSANVYRRAEKDISVNLSDTEFLPKRILPSEESTVYLWMDWHQGWVGIAQLVEHWLVPDQRVVGWVHFKSKGIMFFPRVDCLCLLLFRVHSVSYTHLTLPTKLSV